MNAMSAGSFQMQSTGTAYQRTYSDQSHGSSAEFDLMSSPSTQNSGLLNSPTHERRAVLRLKRRSWRLSSSLTTKPVHGSKTGTTLDVQTSSKSKHAQRQNDSMVYLEGPHVYSCGNCRTHLTSHDDIVSKSFHGRHGRAYLFKSCANVTQGPSEQRRLITGLHTVCDIFCKRCETLLGWTYLKAHESNQKYKEGKFIIEKINLHAEDLGDLVLSHTAGNRYSRNRSSRWDNDHDDEGSEYEVTSS